MKEIQINRNSILIKALRKFDFLDHIDIEYGIDSCTLIKKIFKMCLFVTFTFAILTWMSIIVSIFLGNFLAWIIYTILNGYIYPDELTLIVLVIMSILFCVFLVVGIIRHNKQIKAAIIPNHVTELYISAKNRFCKQVVFVKTEEGNIDV